ncbi:DUF1573 domain-containing protein [bacterium]|nr:DUF1573 domain-containing protein [candidate division CSSED10-310 bacterium]
MSNYRRHLLLYLIGCWLVLLPLSGCFKEKAEEKVDLASTQQPPPVTLNDREKPGEETPVINKDGKNPKIVFAETQHDFGKQISGPDLKHVFNFRNTGEGTLIIENVKAG